MVERHEQRHLEGLCRLALKHQASDLHLKPGKPPALRVEGQIYFTASAPLEADEILALVREVMDERVRREFEETGSADFSYTLEGGDRFRINAFRQRGQTSVAARRVTRHIPDFGELNLPAKTLERICEAPQGLTVFAGVTGCGKSTASRLAWSGSTAADAATSSRSRTRSNSCSTTRKRSSTSGRSGRTSRRSSWR